MSEEQRQRLLDLTHRFNDMRIELLDMRGELLQLVAEADRQARQQECSEHVLATARRGLRASA
jgi:hypothetical protein